MAFWSGLDVVDLLMLCALLLTARIAAARIPGYGRLALPPAVLAGVVGLVLGRSGFDVVNIGSHTLEAVVYHGLAIVFIAMTLQAASPKGGGLEARSVAIAVPLITCAQAVMGLVLVLIWTSALAPLHPGVGLMLPLGFSQGPGQALSMGAAWETMGMEAGGQVGLTIATSGYGVCILLGLALFHGGRRLGWVDKPSEIDTILEGDEPPETKPNSGYGLEPLMGQAALVGTVYLGVFGLLVAAADALADKPQLAAMVWGFHFLVAILLALAVRKGIKILRLPDATDDRLLSRIGGIAVDVASAAAIAAIQFDQVAAFAGPIIALVVPGALGTLVMSVWLAKRAFPNRPFSHAIVLFGTMTGTLPTGLTLLRLEDPELQGPAAKSMVAGVAMSIIPAAPLLLKILPMPVLGWPGSFPGAVWTTVGLLLAYIVVLAIAWRILGPIRSVGRALQIWPSEKHPLAK
jgi:glutamate:Na+ symporter, ESS family